MRVREHGLALLRSEGLRLRTHKDVAGFLTIGFGRRLLLGESFPYRISEEKADSLLRQDVKVAEKSIAALVKVPLTQGQFDALADFVFNLGQSRLASSTLLQDLNAGRYNAAAGQLLCWDHAGHVEVEALKKRREAELELWAA